MPSDFLWNQTTIIYFVDMWIELVRQTNSLLVSNLSTLEMGRGIPQQIQSFQVLRTQISDSKLVCENSKKEEENYDYTP